MTLSKIKKMKDERGFTIVELLIVIVVIAILAAITIVAYNGIQNRARTTEAAANAKEVLNKAETFNADATTANGNATTPGYPTDSAALKAATGTAALSSKVNTLTGATAPASGTPTVIQYLPCPTTGSPKTGAKVGYWDYTTSAVVYLNAGSATGTTAACS